ncbi:DUF4331 family protein [Hyalangium rubrum]|uniref:DUF4331 family protein n=1 Tax=Hyalangium rubrum TaxID=3103134 RepID=A0ABU5GXF8_9BACT|nr:DUF4331 family protein [Hyalangium sp. s54d21]MDY7225721.1 DUF4331 family protein [Hyalangium sp. s54d21]
MKKVLRRSLRRSGLRALSLALVLLVGVSALAADHKDGSIVTNRPSADVTDVFVFPRLDQQNKKRLSLILSSRPSAAPNEVFDTALNYSLRFRPVTGFTSAPFRASVSNEEFRIDCRAKGREPQTMNCKFTRSSGKGPPSLLQEISVNTRDLSGGGNPDFKVFAGPRADQLFTDRARVRMPVWRNTELSSGTDWPGVNTFNGKNVLSIVVDLSVDRYLRATHQTTGAKGEAQYFAAVGEVAELDLSNPGAGAMRRIDRMGRVEITVFMVREDEVRDLWNAEDAFALDPKNVEKYREALRRGLKRLDGFEMLEEGSPETSVLDWPVPHPWVDLLMDDFLIFDLAQPTKPSSTQVGYLGIEIARLTRVAGGGVGGRLPNEDVIERTLTVFINGLARPTPLRGVGVPAPARLTVDEFPFVPPPFE